MKPPSGFKLPDLDEVKLCMPELVRTGVKDKMKEVAGPVCHDQLEEMPEPLEYVTRKPSIHHGRVLEAWEKSPHAKTFAAEYNGAKLIAHVDMAIVLSAMDIEANSQKE